LSGAKVQLSKETLKIGVSIVRAAEINRLELDSHLKIVYHLEKSRRL
jgi:hypothetical protein